MTRRTKRPQNICEDCKYTWYPRGKQVSLRCPRCGSTNTKVKPPNPLTVALGIVVLIVCLIVLCPGAIFKIGSSATSTPAREVAVSPAVTATPELKTILPPKATPTSTFPSLTPPATRRSVAQIGDTIPEVGLGKEDLSMTLIGWAESDIAVSGPYAGSGFYTFTAKPRMKFIILEFEFHNNWVRQQETLYFNKGEVRTDKGYFYQVWSPPLGIHSEEYAPRPSTQEEVENLGGSGTFEDLLPEESVRGHVVFEIPEDEEPEEVELSQVPVPIQLD